MRCAEDISLLEPFGASNPTPVFFMSDVSIIKSNSLKGGKHIKFVFEKDGVTFNAIMFGADYEVFNYNVGEKLDIMFNLDINEYNGYRSVQLVVREVRLAMSTVHKLEEEACRYEEIKNGGTFVESENIIPSREDFAAVYKALKFGDEDCISESRLRTLAGTGINLIKLYIILDVLDETGLCNICRRRGEELIKYSVNDVKEKVNLEESPLLVKIKSQLK
jgi:single-stranded-DNA-specific exonuclease